MYMCECGEIFDEPNSRTEVMGEYQGTPAWDSFGVCPCCDSEEITEVDLCICGEHKDSSEDYCDNCLNFINNAMSSFISSVQGYLHIEYKQAVDLILYDMERR